MKVGSLLAVVNVVHAHQVHVMFRAHLPEPHFAAGAESLEVKLVKPENIPWADMAFPSVEFALRRYLDDRAAEREGHHFADFDRSHWRDRTPT